MFNIHCLFRLDEDITGRMRGESNSFFNNFLGCPFIGRSLCHKLVAMNHMANDSILGLVCFTVLSTCKITILADTGIPEKRKHRIHSIRSFSIWYRLDLRPVRNVA